MTILTMHLLLATGKYKLFARMQGCEWHSADDFTLNEDYYKVEKVIEDTSVDERINKYESNINTNTNRSY
jgi:hypothetical protein